MTVGARTPRWWYDGSRPPGWARLLAPVYAAVVRARAALYSRGVLRRRHPGVPVVVIGNLIAGGSGKTPLAIALVDRLQSAGFTPGVASRGHGRRDARTPRWVDASTPADLAGDEPALIAQRTRARVRVDVDRVAAACALRDAGCDVVVCDDGLQHLPLARDLEVEVVDARRRYGNGLLLPAGPLREPAARAERVDFRVLNCGDDATLEAGFGEWPMRLRPGDAVPLAGGRPVPLAAFAGQRVHAVAGIGDPERFFATLRAAGIAVVPHAFPDHHAFTEADLAFGNALPVLMTQKDAVKCAPFADARCHAVPVEADLPEAFWVALLDRIRHARAPSSA